MTDYTKLSQEEKDALVKKAMADLFDNLGGDYDWKTPEGDQGYMDHNGTFHCATAVAYCAEKVARMIVDGKLKR